jgi:transcriptional regulator with XRE-family HTH domain
MSYGFRPVNVEDIANKPPASRELLAARLSARLTQKQVADAAGCSICYVSLYERGAQGHVPGRRAFARLMAAIERAASR